MIDHMARWLCEGGGALDKATYTALWSCSGGNAIMCVYMLAA